PRLIQRQRIAASGGELPEAALSRGRLRTANPGEVGRQTTENECSKRQYDVGHLLPPRLGLDVRQRALAAIGNARLGDLGQIDRVVALDIFRARDAGDEQFAHFGVEPYFLLTLDHQIAVGQDLGDDGGDVGDQLILAVDRAVALHLGIAVGRQYRAWQHRFGGVGDGVGTDEIGDVGVFRGAAGQLRLVLKFRGVVDVDLHGENVADLVRALVVEKRARAVA